MKIGKLYDIEELRKLGGVVDYVVGTPLTKVYCLAEHPDPKQQHYLSLYKMGEGPLYSILHSVSFGSLRGAQAQSRASFYSVMGLRSRLAGRWSRFAPWRNAISRPAKFSMTMACI